MLSLSNRIRIAANCYFMPDTKDELSRPWETRHWSRADHYPFTT
jgi:hypothetical protein